MFWANTKCRSQEGAVVGSGAICVVVVLLKLWTLAALSPQL